MIHENMASSSCTRVGFDSLTRLGFGCLSQVPQLPSTPMWCVIFTQALMHQYNTMMIQTAGLSTSRMSTPVDAVMVSDRATGVGLMPTAAATAIAVTIATVPYTMTMLSMVLSAILPTTTQVNIRKKAHVRSRPVIRRQKSEVRRQKTEVRMGPVDRHGILSAGPPF